MDRIINCHNLYYVLYGGRIYNFYVDAVVVLAGKYCVWVYVEMCFSIVMVLNSCEILNCITKDCIDMFM